MPFNSISFFVFFAIVTFSYFLLLLASYYFYMQWNTAYALLLLSSTTAAYAGCIFMEKSSSSHGKKILFIGSLCFNLLLLFACKYLNFLSTSLQEILKSIGLNITTPEFNILLPIGISFYTFRSLSYIIDVYWRRTEAEKNYTIFALYVSFFPALLAGPIDRAAGLINQFRTEQRLDMQRIAAGVQLMLWGLFKKVVIADRIAMYVDSIFNNMPHNSGTSYLIAAYLYTFQIYCDFSGYSDMAIGSAKVLGFDLMQNFNIPYFSRNIADFWRRWHISLSTWFRDYLYIPLGGNRRGNIRTYVNLLITMLICGLWHGAAWTFVVWGGLHGAVLCLSRFTNRFREKLYKRLMMPPVIVTAIKLTITFHIVCVLWIFFRAHTVSDALTFICNSVSGIQFSFSAINSLMKTSDLILVMVFIIFMLVYEKTKKSRLNCATQYVCNVIVLASVFWAIVVWGSFNTKQFIYFQF
jgi:D-alanyl-lipoteichoic acid acyltransferase DltB (MBOAT superfamily)